MLEVTSSSSLVYPSPDAALIILLVSAEELLLSGLENERKVTSSSCLPGNRCLGQQQAEWLFGISSLRCFSHSWFYFETKIPITFSHFAPTNSSTLCFLGCSCEGVSKLVRGKKYYEEVQLFTSFSIWMIRFQVRRTQHSPATCFSKPFPEPVNTQRLDTDWSKFKPFIMLTFEI